MTRYKFQRRVETIFEALGLEVFHYGEAPQGCLIKAAVKDPRPWVEFDLRQIKKPFDKSSCYVTLKGLNAVSKLLGTKDIQVTGFDISPDDDDSDAIVYVVAHGVNFKGKRNHGP